jgi:hypothetical protein
MRDQPLPVATGSSTSTGALYRNVQLLVEPWSNESIRQQLEDYSTYVGWPLRSDVGRLEWDDSAGFACIFCGALLLPSEAIAVPGAPSVFQGRHCCRGGKG